MNSPHRSRDSISSNDWSDCPPAPQHGDERTPILSNINGQTYGRNRPDTDACEQSTAKCHPRNYGVGSSPYQKTKRALSPSSGRVTRHSINTCTVSNEQTTPLATRAEEHPNPYATTYSNAKPTAHTVNTSKPTSAAATTASKHSYQRERATKPSFNTPL